MANKIDELTKAEEGLRLRTLIERSANESCAKFAREKKIPGGKSLLSQHIKGVRPISLKSAIAYAEALGIPLSGISPRLAALVGHAKNTTYPTSSEKQPRNYSPQGNITKLPTPNPLSKIMMDIITLAESMTDQGQWELLGQARLLASIHPKTRANRSS